MSETRTRRSKEELLAEIESKIASHKKNIMTLEARKQALLNPKTRRSAISMNSILKKAKQKGLSAKEIAKKLELDIFE